MSKPPVAFMSYVHFDDEHENGRLTEFCRRLSGEVRVQTGDKFDIFQDRKDIAWGQQWKQRIDESIDAVTFLLPIITPGFLKSQACRGEFERFMDREKQLGRNDLILPVYYINSPVLNDEGKREADPLSSVIAGRQYADWRDLRFEPFTSPQVGKMLARMATQIVEALDRGNPLPSLPLTAAVAASQPATQSLPSTNPAGEGVAVQTSDVARHLVQKSEPPTRVVDALHRGDHSSLTDALKAAKPGDRILVRPGLYREGIVIDRPVEIIGDGEISEVIIEATGKDVVLFRANMGRIANLTLRQTGGENWYCIDIAQGRLEVEGCDITSQSLTCVGIHGGADPRLRRNRIHSGKQGGVLVYDNALGTLEDNDIFGNANTGVSIKAGANPTLRRNRIYNGKTGGVFVFENGLGTLEDNDIFGNVNTAVSIASGGNPTLRRNRIHNGKAGGVFVYDDGLGALEENEISGNSGAGLSIKTGGSPTLRRNRICDGESAGVHVFENGQGILEDNEVFGNASAGVAITSGGNPALRRNRIRDGRKAGVHVYDNGQGTLEENDIFGNANSGVEIKTLGNPTLRRNRIHDGVSSGVFVLEDGQGMLEDNEIFGNANAGVFIMSGGNPTLRRNRIHGGKVSGVVVSEEGKGLLEDNDIVDNTRAGVEVKSGGCPTLRRNRITKNGYEAVWVLDGGTGVFEDNDLRENKRGAWDIASESLANVTRARNQE